MPMVRRSRNRSHAYSVWYSRRGLRRATAIAVHTAAPATLKMTNTSCSTHCTAVSPDPVS